MDPPAADAKAEHGLTLTTAARDTMVAGLTDALEKLTGLAQAVGDATIDEAAATPPEVGELFKQISELLVSLAGEAPPAEPPAPPVAAAAPPAVAPAAKGEDDAETAKAGKKISSANLKKIKTAFDALKALIDSTESSTQKAAGDDADDAADPTTERVHKMIESFGTKLEERDAASDAKFAELAKAVGAKNTTIADQKAAIAKAKEQIANLSKRANGPGGGNAGSTGDDGGDPVTKGKPKSWGAWERRMNDKGPNHQPEAAGR